MFISTDEDPSLRIESFATINLRGVSTKLDQLLTFLGIRSHFLSKKSKNMIGTTKTARTTIPIDQSEGAVYRSYIHTNYQTVVFYKKKILCKIVVLLLKTILTLPDVIFRSIFFYIFC